MTTIILLITLCVAVPSRFDDNRYFRVMAEREYDNRVILRYTKSVRDDLKYKAMCYGHSIELIRRLRKDGEYACLMGLYRRGASLPFHYYVHSKRWGVVDIYPEGHGDEPLNGVMLDDKKFHVPGRMPDAKKLSVPEQPVKQRQYA